MEKSLPKKWSLLFFVFLFFSGLPVFAQLSNFTLSVTKTDENCSGNGSLSFQVSNTTPQATFVYSIYLLPNTINPVGVTSSGSITGLTAGTYRVIATQTLGSLSNTQQQDVTIVNHINPLAFQLVGAPIDCIHGRITVYVTQGNPASYEIISGPVIVPAQTSNVLQNLPVGQYVIRVNDICGDGIVQTYSLAAISNLNISPLTQICGSPSCTQASGEIKISAEAGGMIYYPLTVTTAIIPPGGGAPVVTTQTIASGAPAPPTAHATIDMPILPGLTYSYTINVQDACGNTFNYSGTDLIRTESIEVLNSTDPLAPTFIDIKTCNMVPPLTVTFLDAPAGFNPTLFNAGHPGPFFFSPIRYASTPDHSLPLGHYEVQVTDACGISHSGECNIGNCRPDVSATPICSTFGLIKIRLINTVVITQAPPSFPFPLPYTGEVVGNQFMMQLPLGSYTFEGMDQCDQPYTIGRVIDLATYNITADNEGGCETNTGSITIEYANVGLELAIVGVSIIGAPPEFSAPLPYDASMFIDHTSSIIKVYITGLAAGDYQLQVTDVCGNHYPLSATVPQYISTAPPTAVFLKGCTNGLGSMYMDTPNRKFTQVIMTAAPAAFITPLPYNVSFNLNSQGKFFMNDLPEGNYTFQTLDVCGISSQIDVVVPGYHVLQSDVVVVENCGSFDLMLNHFMEQPYAQRFWLQKLDQVTGLWKHPYTGAVYIDGTVPDATNSYQLYNYSTNLNIALNGKFRVVKVNQVYSNASAAYTNCPMVVIKEFEFTGELKVLNASGVQCADSTYNTFITVSGVPPFTFRITTKDGQPFALNNGTSNYFSNLAPGMYNFQIEDHCGNIVNRIYDIATLLEPSVSQSNLCNGQNGKLMVAAAPFLSYQWWKAGAPTVILSTSNTLNFTPFFSSINAGQYFVRIYSNSSLSCLDKTLSYIIPTSSNPKAGNDHAVSVCGNMTAVNLFTLLDGDFDTTGSWEEITHSGTLTGALWNSVNVAFGTYQFKYHVNGFCDDFDEALITIQLKPNPDVPEILSGSVLCSGQPFQFEVNPIFNATYNWTGPNDFSSNLQNPTLQNPTFADSGLYTVNVAVDGCQSFNEVPLGFALPPDFSLQNGCVTGAYTLKVIPNENSFDPDAVTYHWTGPNNFTSNQNPIGITGFASGNYSATVTNTEGCSVTKNVNINSTFCGVVQLGISPNNDGFNDVLDLTGLGREIRFKIFNRYGTMVYEQDDYTNQWHGQDYHNRQLPDATYFYYIKLKSGEEKTGWVYVTR